MRGHLRYSRLMPYIRRIVQYVGEYTDQLRHGTCEVIQFRRLRRIWNGGVHLLEVVPEFLEARHSVSVVQEHLSKAAVSQLSQQSIATNTADLAPSMPIIYRMVAELLEEAFQQLQIVADHSIGR